MPRPLPDAARVWRDVEEHLAPTFSLWASDRVIVFYLLRASRLAGQRVITMPARALSRATLLSRSTVRTALRRLFARGIIRVLRRDYSGLRIEVKLPREIPGCVTGTRLPDGRSLDSLDFWTSRNRRSLIFQRDGNRCFYCLRRLRANDRVLDHVIPRVHACRLVASARRKSARLSTGDPRPRPDANALRADGVPRGRAGSPTDAANSHAAFANSYRNLVACCSSCNMAKRDRPATDLLRRLYREQKISACELSDRIRKLKLLAEGRLKPRIAQHRSLP